MSEKELKNNEKLSGGSKITTEDTDKKRKMDAHNLTVQTKNGAKELLHTGITPKISITNSFDDSTVKVISKMAMINLNYSVSIAPNIRFLTSFDSSLSTPDKEWNPQRVNFVSTQAPRVLFGVLNDTMIDAKPVHFLHKLVLPNFRNGRVLLVDKLEDKTSMAYINQNEPSMQVFTATQQTGSLDASGENLEELPRILENNFGFDISGMASDDTHIIILEEKGNNIFTFLADVISQLLREKGIEKVLTKTYTLTEIEQFKNDLLSQYNISFLDGKYDKSTDLNHDDKRFQSTDLNHDDKRFQNRIIEFAASKKASYLIFRRIPEGSELRQFLKNSKEWSDGSVRPILVDVKSASAQLAYCIWGLSDGEELHTFDNAYNTARNKFKEKLNDALSGKNYIYKRSTKRNEGNESEDHFNMKVMLVYLLAKKYGLNSVEAIQEKIKTEEDVGEKIFDVFDEIDKAAYEVETLYGTAPNPLEKIENTVENCINAGITKVNVILNPLTAFIHLDELYHLRADLRKEKQIEFYILTANNSLMAFPDYIKNLNAVS